MATTSAIGAGEGIAPTRGDFTRGTMLRNVAIALAVAAGLAGIVVALWGPSSLGLGELQARSVAWTIPVFALAGALAIFNYPRTGAAVVTGSLLISMLAFTGGGFGGAAVEIEGLAGMTRGINLACFLLLFAIAGVAASLALNRLGVLNQLMMNISLVVVAALIVVGLLGLHSFMAAPAAVWTGGVPRVLGNGYNPVLFGVFFLSGAAALVSLYSIVANGDAVAVSNIRNGATVRPDWVTRFAAAKLASIPMILTVLVVFIGGTIWTVVFSFTNAKSFPMGDFVGWAQYERLFRTTRWHISVRNLAVFGSLSLIFSFVIGFLLAVFLDQKIRFESAFRTIFLYPFALSFIVTGHVWAWILNPAFGLQKAMRDMGWTSFSFDWLTNRHMVVYTLVIAGLWQGTGLIMALMLAGLRGIDDEVWKAARIDGIPKWRTYWSIVLPMMRPVLITTLVIAASGVVRVYDLVVALTQGGPGLASEVPAKYVYEFMFTGNLAQGLAASAVMLVTVGIIIVPWAIIEFGGKKSN